MSADNNNFLDLSGLSRWYVLYTRPHFEKRVDKGLKELGFLSYLPLQKELRQWNDRKSWVEIPLFKSYVFINTSLKEKNKAFNVNGVVKYISIGKQLAAVSEQEIERIKKLYQYEQKISIEYDKLSTGREVEINNGILKGLRGYLTQVRNNKKIYLHIESLNCFASFIADINLISFKYT